MMATWKYHDFAKENPYNMIPKALDSMFPRKYSRDVPES
jgi:hypothetical protein